MRVWLCIVIAALVMTIWSVRLAHTGSFDFTLASDTLSGAPGSVVTFNGTLTNTSMADIFLNGVLSFIPPPDLTVDDQPFFLNTPLFLPPGESFTGELFNVNIGPQAAANTYHGHFTIQGGVDATTFDTLASANFSVQVTSPAAVPEPGTIALFVTGCLGLLGYGWLHRMSKMT